MQSVYNYVVEPLGERYNNTKSIGDKELILNTEVYNHQHVNREAKVLSTPRISNLDIQPGDIVTVYQGIAHQLEAMSDGVIFETSTFDAVEDSYRVEKGDSQR